MHTINGFTSIIYDEKLDLNRGVLTFIIPNDMKINSDTNYNVIIDSILIKKVDSLIEKKLLK